MSRATRRDFLETGIGAAVALASPWARGADRGPVQAAPPKARVAAVRGDKLGPMTRDVLDALGGVRAVVAKGDTVFLKPNLVTFPWAPHNQCFRAGECTKPEIIIAVAEECLKAGAAKVIIGDGSQLPRFDWRHAVTLDGSTNLVKEAERLNRSYRGKVTLACLETDSPRWVEVPSSTRLKKIAISSLAADADKVISLPVAKTHSWAQLTLALKNFIGITPLSRYAQLVDNTWWNRGTFDHSSPEAIAQVYLDIVKALRPALSVIDFSIGLEGDGPSTSQGGETVDMKKRLGSWLVIASRDIMAADATAARIMSHDPEKVKQLTMGFAMGLGEIRAECIQVVGEKLGNLRVAWKPARMKGHKAKG